MNANFGIFEELVGKIYKKSRKAKYAERAFEELNNLLEEIKGENCAKENEE